MTQANGGRPDKTERMDLDISPISEIAQSTLWSLQPGYAQSADEIVERYVEVGLRLGSADVRFRREVARLGIRTLRSRGWPIRTIPGWRYDGVRSTQAISTEGILGDLVVHFESNIGRVIDVDEVETVVGPRRTKQALAGLVSQAASTLQRMGVEIHTATSWQLIPSAEDRRVVLEEAGLVAA